MSGCITPLLVTGAVVARLLRVRNGNRIPAGRMLTAMACLVAAGLVVTSGCLSGHDGGPSALSPTAIPTATPAGTAPASPADTTPAGAGTCRQGLADCSGFCRDLTSDIGNCGVCGKTCPSNSACRDRQCSCSDGFIASLDGTCHPVAAVTGTVTGCDNHPGTKLCDNQCVATDTDPGHCGSCGHACLSGQNCIGGQCTAAVQACGNGLTTCNGQCVSIQTDINNCGTCGNVCMTNIMGTDTGKVCQSGQCTCPLGQTTCGVYSDALHANVDTCTDVKTDLLNCGKCGSVCMANIMGTDTGKVCQNGQCTCPQGQTNCGIYSDALHANVDKCTDMKTDLFNCGKCGNSCTSSQTCSNGQCIARLGKYVPKTSFEIVTP